MSVMADQLTRVEVEEALANMLARARREFAVIGTRTAPSAWDIRHAALDHLLREWEKAGA